MILCTMKSILKYNSIYYAAPCTVRVDRSTVSQCCKALLCWTCGWHSARIWWHRHPPPTSPLVSAAGTWDARDAATAGYDDLFLTDDVVFGIGAGDAGRIYWIGWLNWLGFRGRLGTESETGRQGWIARKFYVVWLTDRASILMCGQFHSIGH